MCIDLHRQPVKLGLHLLQNRIHLSLIAPPTTIQFSPSSFNALNSCGSSIGILTRLLLSFHLRIAIHLPSIHLAPYISFLSHYSFLPLCHLITFSSFLRWLQPFSMGIWQSPGLTTLSSQFELDTICYQHSSFSLFEPLVCSID